MIFTVGAILVVLSCIGAAFLSDFPSEEEILAVGGSLFIGGLMCIGSVVFYVGQFLP